MGLRGDGIKSDVHNTADDSFSYDDEVIGFSDDSFSNDDEVIRSSGSTDSIYQLNDMRTTRMMMLMMILAILLAFSCMLLKMALIEDS